MSESGALRAIKAAFGWLTFELGIWLWGFVLFLWLSALLASLAWGLTHPICKGAGVNPYCVVKDNGTVIASITAVLGVVWSWFLQMQQKERELDIRAAEAKRIKGRSSR